MHVLSCTGAGMPVEMSVAPIMPVWYDGDMFHGSVRPQNLPARRRRALPPCPKCGGSLLFEADVAEGLLLHKCLQCGLIESYFWLERRSQTVVYLPPDTDPPEGLSRD